MAIQIKSFNQSLGDMIRKIIAETALNDVNQGSVLLTLLEAAAANDFENNTAILNVLELLNIDALKNNDLDARAGDYGLTRYAAIKASGPVNILNTNIVKRSTNLYVIKPAPIAGQNTLFVNDTTGWASSGNLYIGRGTSNFEGPVAYTSITVFPTYSQINLSSALQKDHLLSDTVIDAQGQPDRLISAGTIVSIPANNQNPEIQYATIRDAVIPAGETEVDGVEVLALVAGSSGNAGINTITAFNVAPFAGAAVTNTTAFTDGADIETDDELRNRLKSYATTLARGTAPSIIASVIGVSDPTDNNQVASAVITEPVSIGEPSILYIDDGTGFQPSYKGQSVDVLLTNAKGTEEFFQLANYPVPRPQVVNTQSGPFNVKDGSYLRVIVDGTEETIFFATTQFVNISNATLAEIIVAINSNSTIFKARFTNNSTNILIYPVAFDAEIIQVGTQRNEDDPTLFINNLLKFPTDEFSYISLFKNSTRLFEKAKNATVETSSFATWNITGTGDIIISVDATPAQDRAFVLSDFAGAASFSELTLDQWVTAFNSKFAGLTAVTTPSQTMKITSNLVGAHSSINVTGGTYFSKWFPSQVTSSVGQTQQFQLNRQTGNLRVFDINAGDNLSAGTPDARGFQTSSITTSGNYNVGSDSAGRPSEMIVVVDSTYCDQRSIPLIVGATMDVSNPSGSVMRITSSTTNAFSALLPGDWIYIVPRTSGWFDPANTGLYKIVDKGQHTTAAVDTFVDVENVGVVTQSGISIADSLDIQAFTSDGFPQIWRGTYVSNPPAASLSSVIASLNTDLINVTASVYDSNAIKLTSNTENSGSIAIPVSVGNASILFAETVSAQFGNPPMIANRVSNKDLISWFKFTNPTSTNVWLNRHVYEDVKGLLDSNSVPDSPPFPGPYSETLTSSGFVSNITYDDYVSMTRGNNRGQFRNVAALVASNQVGTQEGTPRTLLDHIAGDEYQVVKPVQLSSDDSIVVVMDQDQSTKSVDIIMARTGQVNSGSGMSSFTPTTTEFSANDADNEPGIDFSNTTVWGTTINNTNFSDYAVWMYARNWYAAGGLGSGNGQMLVRSAQFGPNGQGLRFALDYPTTFGQAASTTYINTPSFSTLTYLFGSGPARPIAVSAGDSIAVKGPYPSAATNFPNGSVSTGNYFDYTFSAGNFTTVQVGDVLSIVNGSGVTNANSGQMRIAAKSGNTFRLFNPGASNTAPGAPEIVTFTTRADVVGTPTQYVISTVADVAGSLHQKYFIIYDTEGSVAVWYDVNNTGASPPPAGTNRYIKVATVVTGETANNVAVKTAQVIALDNAFTVNQITNQVTITNKINGALANAGAGTSGFGVATTTGTANNSVTGKYFIIYDENGSVAVWYDVGNSGTPEPFHGADRSIKVSGVNFGDSAATVAAATVAAVNPDISFGASNISSAVTITNALNGNVPNGNAGTSGFTSFANTDGSLPTSELITNANLVNMFPLISNDVATIATTVNATSILQLVAVGLGTLTIPKATREDDYAYAGNSTALAYGHNPTNPALRGYIGLYDGVAYVKSFSNANPNFTLKAALTLNGVAPSIYSMDTCPNTGSATLGEQFKLIPVSVKNVYHHFTQKALSQLPIVADVSISDNRKNVQIVSKNLGSAGAIEVLGGNANKAQSYILAESEDTNDTSGAYLLVKVPAFPDTFNQGDYVQVQNDAGVKRLSRLLSSDSINVTIPSAAVAQYNYNPKVINVSSGTTFTITDVSGSYSRPSGYVWRWTHGGGATLAQVQAGDLLMAFGNTLSYAQGNKVGTPGNGEITGFPIIAVNDLSNYVDVVNPYGKAMSSTAVGSGNTVQICPTPGIRWQLSHAAKAPILSLVSNGTTVTAITQEPHLMNSGDSVDIADSNFVPDATYTNITSTGPTTFTFGYVSASFSEGQVGASSIKTGLVPTRYRVEKLGFNNMVRIARQDGAEPRFVDAGVAVDDYVVFGGNTFSANNNGRFRVVAVDNDSIIVIKSVAVDQLDTTRPFNNQSLQATWTANTDVVTGVAGTFKYLSVGDWVKKPEDPDSFYLQIISMNPGSPASATSITLGGNYEGATAIAPGISYDQLNDHDKGVILQGTDDIMVFEGDSVVDGDMLSIQNIINSSWFNVNNIGNFNITQFGVDGITYKPYVAISNASAVAETNRLMSVNVNGVYITESLVNKFYSIRKVTRVAMDDLSTDKRSIYMVPDNRSYKFSNANATSLLHLGKLGYNTDVTTGVDGYLYYTGLLQRVQRIVDGYEPDIANFPGRRAVGGLIETLPPLVNQLNIAITVATNEGVNLGDISNNIKSVIINYVQGLGVGQDVILSEIIAQVMNIKGVDAVTFTSPSPSTERITIASNERANIKPENIGIASG